MAATKMRSLSFAAAVLVVLLSFSSSSSTAFAAPAPPPPPATNGTLRLHGQAPFPLSEPLAVSPADRLFLSAQTSNGVAVVAPFDSKLLGVTQLGGKLPATLGALYRGQAIVHGSGFSPDRRTVAAVCVGSDSVVFLDATGERDYGEKEKERERELVFSPFFFFPLFFFSLFLPFSSPFFLSALSHTKHKHTNTQTQNNKTTKNRSPQHHLGGPEPS